MSKHPLTLCLWFDQEAEAAARFYTGIFRESSIGRISRYGKEGFEFHGKPEGTVMTIEFQLNGMRFIGLNGGPQFRHSEAASVVVHADTQEEIDAYWKKLSEGGEEGPCGWLKDKFGVSWQVVPSALPGYLSDPDPEKVRRVTQAFLQMKKFDLEKLRAAYENENN